MHSPDPSALPSPSLAYPPGTEHIRVSDAEREAVARVISRAAGEGMLTLEEADERIRQAYAARTRGDLMPLTADLPDGGRRLLDPEPKKRNAGWLVKYPRLAWLVPLAALLIGIWAVTSIAAGEVNYFWPVWPIMFIGFAVIHRGPRGHGPGTSDRS